MSNKHELVVGDIIQFNEKAANHHFKGYTEIYKGRPCPDTKSLKGRYFLIMQCIPDDGAHSFHGIEIFPTKSGSGALIVPSEIPYPYRYDYDRGEGFIHNTYRSGDDWDFVKHVDLTIAIKTKHQYYV